jgi:hypothetical protein
MSCKLGTSRICGMLGIVVWLEWRNDRNGRTTGTIGIGTRNKRNVGWELQLLLGKGTVAVLTCGSNRNGPPRMRSPTRFSLFSFLSCSGVCINKHNLFPRENVTYWLQNWHPTQKVLLHSANYQRTFNFE